MLNVSKVASNSSAGASSLGHDLTPAVGSFKVIRLGETQPDDAKDGTSKVGTFRSGQPYATPH